MLYYSGMLMLINVFTVVDIMSKFSARFDAKAAKDAKRKGKANPPGSLSAGGTETIPGPTDAAIVLLAPGTKGSLRVRPPLFPGSTREVKLARRRDRKYFKVEFVCIVLFLS
jgi:hypothetical protein